MALVQRRILSKPTADSRQPDEDSKAVGSSSDGGSNLPANLLAVALVGVALTLLWIQRQPPSSSALLLDRLMNDRNYEGVHWEVVPGVTFSAFLRRRLSSNATTSSLVVEASIGPHWAHLLIESQQQCPFPRFAMRFQGDDALVHVPLVEEVSEERSSAWTGEWTFPASAATYSLDVHFYGCDKDALWSQEKVGPAAQVRVVVEEESLPTAVMATTTTSLFPPSFWRRQDGQLLWAPLSSGQQQQQTIVQTSDSPVVTESVASGEKGFYEFRDLGNYELLCFLGNQTMQEIRREFLELRPHLFAHQRPFKFHMYHLAAESLQRPDRDWSVSHKQRIRKCKHLLVNLDELQGRLSQRAYQTQLYTFVGHLLKLMNDTTFPIRLFTWMQPPWQATACHSPFLPRTTDHPCNDVLKSLFHSQSFPSRVKLLDNTDLTLPLLGDSRSNRALANVALRVFVVAGEQVALWRAAGQRGAVDGLHRNGTVEPNFELVPYEGW